MVPHGLPLDEGALARLKARYGEPHRAYHTWTHIEALLAGLAAHSSLVSDTTPVGLAILYHDAVYDPLSATNEEDSAELLEEEVGATLDVETLAATRAMIVATAGHALPSFGTESFRADCAVFLDLDLSIFAAPRPEFAAYHEAVRMEYAHVTPTVYAAARRDVLKGFLARERLFLSPALSSEWDWRARANLTWAISRLPNPTAADDLAYRQALLPVDSVEGFRRTRVHDIVRAACMPDGPARGDVLRALARTGYDATGLQRVAATTPGFGREEAVRLAELLALGSDQTQNFGNVMQESRNAG
ncbi:MAG: hypothetical protein H6923_04435 [Alphaproteobacteria bacterium]|nr:hypothetical protein [Alphaproteobacteria bacterium]